MYNKLIICLSVALSIFTAHDSTYLGQSTICKHDCNSKIQSESNQSCGDCLVETNTFLLARALSFYTYPIVTKLFSVNRLFYKVLIRIYNYSRPPPV